jgi:hypothetical protein
MHAQFAVQRAGVLSKIGDDEDAECGICGRWKQPRTERRITASGIGKRVSESTTISWVRFTRSFLTVHAAYNIRPTKLSFLTRSHSRSLPKPTSSSCSTTGMLAQPEVVSHP